MAEVGRTAAELPSADVRHFVDAAERLIAPFVAADLFAGTVLIASGEDILLRQGFGLADREWGVAHVPHGKFRIGSLTKQFTATAILQLMEQDRLRLEDRIACHYPEAPAAWDDVTLLHLLTHTSGIPSYTSLAHFFEAAARIERSPKEIIALTRDAPLHFPPGSRFKYNNGGYVILGHVVELLSGMAYEDYIARNILQPLGLADTGYEHTETLIACRARGYRFENGRCENAAFIAMSVPHAAGAIYSTADDLLVWLRALIAAKPISGSSVALMLRDHGHGYGMGFAIQRQFGRPHLVHAGGINGFSVVVSHYPDADLSLVVLANIQGAPVQKLARDLAALYFGIPQDEEVSLDPALLADYVGCYRLEDDKILRVSQEGARLFVEWDGRGKQEAVATDDHHFRGRFAEWSLGFEADGVALASRAILKQNSRSWNAPRVADETL